MIRYTLRCEREHTFESWFQDSAAYDTQVKRKLVSCPVCESVKIDKAIMAPAISGARKSSRWIFSIICAYRSGKPTS